ncbi:MAG: hypothetical protein LWX56_00210 [Ignavibacteria bacterium]|nr:hypothetical protein [Ignavibacteria bacterium]
MNSSLGVFVIPVFQLEGDIHLPIKDFIKSEDFNTLADVMRDVLIDQFTTAGAENVKIFDYSLELSRDEIQSDDNFPARSVLECLQSFIEREVKKYEQVLLVNQNIVGITTDAISNIMNLLSIEEDVNLLLLDQNKRCCGNGFLNYSPEFLDYCLKHPDLDTIFRAYNVDRFWLTREPFFSLKDIDDFRLLYNVLSQRTNTHFCKNEFYDIFTDLFIEYKDLLK